MAECSGSVSAVSNNVNTQKQSSAVQSTDSADEDKTDKGKFVGFATLLPLQDDYDQPK